MATAAVDARRAMYHGGSMTVLRFDRFEFHPHSGELVAGVRACA